jgi:polyisoprenyl-phosphate glycosyltransferase
MPVSDDDSSAPAGAYALDRGLDHPLASCARGCAEDARQLLGESFVNEFGVPDRAPALREIDGSLPASTLRADGPSMVRNHETIIRRKRRSPCFRLSVVIPCFNEQEMIATTYHRVIDVLGSKEFQLELIFVNDGSNDRTGDILTRIAADDARVTLVTLSRNFGHQAAISAGLAHSRGNATAIIDADLQDPPEVVLGMIDRWLEGYDVVYGVRKKRKEARWKKICYTLFYKIFKHVAFIDTPLDAGDFSLLGRRVVEEINRLPEKERFFRGLRAWVGFTQIGFEYERAPRVCGVTKYSFLKLLRLAADGIFNFSTAPLTFVFYAGCMITTLSLLALGVIILLLTTNTVFFELTGDDVRGVSIISTVLFIGGIQLTGIGILGEYVGRIYQEVKARPAFIARNSPVATSTASHRNDTDEARTAYPAAAADRPNSCGFKGPGS